MRKNLGYAWLVIQWLIGLFVVIFLFDSVYSSTDRAIIALLLMIYIQILAFSNQYTLNTVRAAFVMAKDIDKIKALINENVAEHYSSEEIEEAEKNIGYLEKRRIIASIFYFIILLIAAYHIISV